jgi:hypothetical protein
MEAPDESSIAEIPVPFVFVGRVGQVACMRGKGESKSIKHRHWSCALGSCSQKSRLKI